MVKTTTVQKIWMGKTTTIQEFWLPYKKWEVVEFPSHFFINTILNFGQEWNLNSQISLNFDIWIVISKAKFKKKLNGQTRFT